MISQAELTSLAALARLSLNEAEQATLIHDLDAILDYVGQLKEAIFVENRENWPPPPISNKADILREDGAPHSRLASRRFKVKAIFSE